MSNRIRDEPSLIKSHDFNEVQRFRKKQTKVITLKTDPRQKERSIKESPKGLGKTKRKKQSYEQK